LSKDEKEILVLRIVEGYSINETSKMLNKPEGTVKSNQYRALQKLKKILGKCNYFSD
ncbi:MAG TPA: RNA polymerase subunit sigma, partial [Clostridiaceae bacterium]|nr:RNA polymerase subunit sigma [Clostridiaceae bacterium]HBG38230.1 RNA polymerase subunit sigma [Clostridiaceae bacterium]